MAKKKPAKLKRRTREHVLEDLSVHHVSGFVLQEGYTVQRISGDYGYDLFVTTFDDKGHVERGVSAHQRRLRLRPLRDDV